MVVTFLVLPSLDHASRSQGCVDLVDAGHILGKCRVVLLLDVEAETRLGIVVGGFGLQGQEVGEGLVGELVPAESLFVVGVGASYRDVSGEVREGIADRRIGYDVFEGLGRHVGGDAAALVSECEGDVVARAVLEERVKEVLLLGSRIGEQAHHALVLRDEGLGQGVERLIAVDHALREEVIGIGIVVRRLDRDGCIVERNLEGIRRGGYGVGGDDTCLVQSECQAVDRCLGHESVIGGGVGSRGDLRCVELLEGVVSVLAIQALEHGNHIDCGRIGIVAVFFTERCGLDGGPIVVPVVILGSNADGNRTGGLAYQLEREADTTGSGVDSESLSLQPVNAHMQHNIIPQKAISFFIEQNLRLGIYRLQI